VKSSRYRKQFQSAMNEICVEIGCSPCEDIAEQDDEVLMELTVDDVTFSIRHAIAPAPERVVLEGRFGPPPADRTCEILLRLMQINRELLNTDNGAFCFDGHRGDISYAYACDLNEITGKELLQMMIHVASQAKEWRNSHFLDETQNTEHAASAMPIFG